MEPMDFNARNIAEFRSSGGKLGGPFEGAPVLLLTTVGAKSGQQRISPMMYLPEGERIFVFASNAGSDRHPSWYHNLRANPSATVEVGTQTRAVTAVEITGAEHDREPTVGVLLAQGGQHRLQRARFVCVVHQGQEVLPGVDRLQPARHRGRTQPRRGLFWRDVDGVQQRNGQQRSLRHKRPVQPVPPQHRKAQQALPLPTCPGKTLCKMRACAKLLSSPCKTTAIYA